MKKKEFIAYIQNLLEELYPSPEPSLKHKDPYTLLIAVLLSARSTDKKVNEVTPYLFKLADTPEKMVQLRVEEIQAIIKPCGLSLQVRCDTTQKSIARIGLDSSKLFDHQYAKCLRQAQQWFELQQDLSLRRAR